MADQSVNVKWDYWFQCFDRTPTEGNDAEKMLLRRTRDATWLYGQLVEKFGEPQAKDQ